MSEIPRLTPCLIQEDAYYTCICPESQVSIVNQPQRACFISQRRLLSDTCNFIWEHTVQYSTVQYSTYSDCTHIISSYRHTSDYFNYSNGSISITTKSKMLPSVTQSCLNLHIVNFNCSLFNINTALLFTLNMLSTHFICDCTQR